MSGAGKKQRPRQLTPELRVFDRYYLKRVLGHGGMGSVWLAHDRILEQPVALKFLASQLFQNHHEIERLKAEMRRNLKLSHPNIVRIFNFEQDGEGAAIAMEYVDGWSLWAMRVDKPRQIFDVVEIAPWIRQLCDALEYAHTEAHIVHRDLKPANLLLNSRGQIKVTDFGLSRELHAQPEPGGVPPTVVGTDWYMGPQQWTGEAPAVADDIYSLGATIYELLTGKPPFYEGDILKQVFEEVPPPMTERLHQFGIDDVVVPLAWEETIAACLAKEPDRRPISARDVVIRLGLMEGMAAPLPQVKAIEPATSETIEETTEEAAETVGSPAEVSEEEKAEPELAATTEAEPAKQSRSFLIPVLLIVIALLAFTAWNSVQRIRINNRIGAAVPEQPLERGRVWKNSLGMKFVSVPGTVTMFSIWETRVQDFEVFARDTGFDPGTDMLRLDAAGKWRVGGVSWRNPDFAQATNSPVVGVTWRDAEKFCEWLTARERKSGILKSNQCYRLPRMTEWIYAAGTALYPWGDDWPPPAGAGNFAGEELRTSVTNHSVIDGYQDGFVETSPVGSFRSNTFGIYDLAGNAWEFCADGPENAPNARWLMGGSWESGARDQFLIANRARGDGTRRYAHRGFRCVLAWTSGSITGGSQ